MTDTPQKLPALDEYVDLPELLQITRHTFPSRDSLKWFIRQHRDSLADAGAVINITGRLRFHPARFQLAAVDICRHAAKKVGAVR